VSTPQGETDWPSNIGVNDGSSPTHDVVASSERITEGSNRVLGPDENSSAEVSRSLFSSYKKKMASMPTL
jgi:hypothetical protein